MGGYGFVDIQHPAHGRAAVIAGASLLIALLPEHDIDEQRQVIFRLAGLRDFIHIAGVRPGHEGLMRVAAKSAAPGAARGSHAAVFKRDALKRRRHGQTVQGKRFRAVVDVCVGQPHLVFHLYGQHGALKAVIVPHKGHQPGKGGLVGIQRGGAKGGKRGDRPAVRPLSYAVGLGIQLHPFGRVVGVAVLAGAKPEQDQVKPMDTAAVNQVSRVRKIILSRQGFSAKPIDRSLQQVTAVGLYRRDLQIQHPRVAGGGVVRLQAKRQQGRAIGFSEDVHVTSLIGQCCAAWLISRTVSPNCMLPPTVMIRGV